MQHTLRKISDWCFFTCLDHVSYVVPGGTVFVVLSYCLFTYLDCALFTEYTFLGVKVTLPGVCDGRPLDLFTHWSSFLSE